MQDMHDMQDRARRPRPSRSTLVGVLLVGMLTAGMTGAVAETGDEEPTDYTGSVEVVRGPADPGGTSSDDDRDDTIEGRVFLDADRDSRSRGEDGVEGVMVSNGREVVTTDAEGYYELPAYENMTVFVTKPAGFDVPVDEDNVPQFYYHHLPGGSPPLRFEGLPPTGPLPAAVNFPLVVSAASAETPDAVSCAIIGDTQTYAGREIGYFRDGVVEDIAERDAERDDLDECGALILGDVMGDDLGLYPRFKEAASLMGVPVRAVPGNHDLDFDAETDEHSFDTYRREIGPAYYSFDVGNVHFVGLDNVEYPCTSEAREECGDPENHPRYNGVIGEEQLAWLENDLALVPEDKLIVVATHIPLVSFAIQDSTLSQTDDAAALYALLEGRPALSLSAHTHTLENLDTGVSYEGWQGAVGVESLPFPHVVAGAGAGAWWGGDLDADGIPMGFRAADGTPGGYSVFDFDGSDYTNRFYATAFGDDTEMALSLNSPHFREWADALIAYDERFEPETTTAPPPVNINDLGDPNVVTDEDLAGDTWLVANVWNGSDDTQVTAQVNDGEPLTMRRTQDGDGEGIREGLEFADPFASTRLLQVARYAFRSASGNERAQGYERFGGADFGPSDPRPEGQGVLSSPHIWRLPLPADLPEGAHTATVMVTEPDGRAYTEILSFEVYDERPPQFFRTEVFEDEEG